jgi:hypothetical protein
LPSEHTVATDGLSFIFTEPQNLSHNYYVGAEFVDNFKGGGGGGGQVLNTVKPLFCPTVENQRDILNWSCEPF